MRWARISVVTTHEGADLIANILMELGAAGTEIDDPSLVNEYIDAGLWDYTDLPRAEDTETVTVRAYLPEDARLESSLLALAERIAALRHAGAALGAGTISHSFVADEDWAETWKAYIHTEKIGERIVVRPTWEEYTPSADEIVIELDPGAAFGTGAHATTAMCLRWLEHLVSPGMRVYDVGCGSGILAVAAAKLGAGEVIAMDYDPVAVSVAEENIRQNNVHNVVACESDLLSACEGAAPAELITANIIADVIIRLFAQLDRHLAPGGTLLASGIIDDRIAGVEHAAAEHGFTVLDMTCEKEWAAMIIRRTSDLKN
ncbi:50S ribosomal protein L11 methyltransferase [Selenomonas noxia]|jgi:ribosomal protein L11 methyltransferase|uniref:Ribosomal protein L11 methyltransferase n=1 Tax=Selenomonas noxia F0398 TaxID=702437 RepID=A0ABP2MRY3_9FIRM|nr:50S ribosomal protein L11 methyltransferase [Selenomonas noxia]EHG25669.1 50S ribosomal protein L11 methyltransferase [Selenomonas noxia F0398]MBF1662044.1 50S ribosomal protein L11 methyltransferase [Selenomonas noxia]